MFITSTWDDCLTKCLSHLGMVAVEGARRSHGSKWQICRSPSPEASISPRCPGRIGWHHHPIASFLIETHTKIKVRNHQGVSSHHMIDMCIFSEAYLPKKEPPVVMAMWSR